MSCYTSSSSVASAVERKIKPEIDSLKAEMKRHFTLSAAKQTDMQNQMNRIEGKLDQLIAALTPTELSKPSLVSKKAANGA